MGAFPTIVTVISVVNLVGSLSSCIGSGLIVICYLILPIKRHFRHSLILNLAIADFLNSSNNSVSGLWKLIRQREIPMSAGCVANGFFSQISVQGTDCSILAIAIVTVYSLTRKTQIRETLPRTTTIAICASTWILPITTSFTALGLNKYGAVSGNWCWIVAQPAYFRYAMTHGWRFAFIFSEIIMYTYLHFYVRKRFGALLEASKDRSEDAVENRRSTPGPVEGSVLPVVDSRDSITPVPVGEDLESQLGRERVETWLSEDTMGKDSMMDSQPPNTQSSEASKKNRWTSVFAHRRGDSADKKDPTAQRTSRVRKILLLNAYPAAYIILWIPGICNRMVEASGNSSRVLQILQASTQFIGLANAITYGWNERVIRQLREYFAERWAKDRRASVLELSTEKVETRPKTLVKTMSSREKLRELREGLREGLKREANEEVLEDQGHLVFANGRWEWSRSTSFNNQET